MDMGCIQIPVYRLSIFRPIIAIVNGDTFLECEGQGTENPSLGIQVNTISIRSDLTYSTSLGLASEKVPYPVTNLCNLCGTVEGMIMLSNLESNNQ